MSAVILVPIRALVVVLAVLLTSACLHGTPTTRTIGAISGIAVSGQPGSRPDVQVERSLAVDETLIRTIEEGEGPTVSLDEVFVIHLTIVNGRTGEVAVSTYDKGQTAMAVTNSDETLFPVLTRALVGQHQGARVVVAATAEDTYGEDGAPQYDVRPGDPLVLVADVVAVPPEEVLDGARGFPEPLRPGVPRVAMADGEPTGLLFGAEDTVVPKPDRLVVVPLVAGDGPVVEAHDLVTIDYLGQVWAEPDQFANTYPTEPVTVALGADRVIPAWEQALVGVARGSRVLVLTPPALAFASTGNPPDIPGDATLAYVIDVRGVS